MARVNDVYRLLDEKYPYCIQEDYDNSGIMADCGRDEEKRLVALHLRKSVVGDGVPQGAPSIG